MKKAFRNEPGALFQVYEICLRRLINWKLCRKRCLIDPPDFAHEDQAENVDEPEPGKTDDDGNNGDYDADKIFLDDAAYQSVDNLDDVNAGQREDDLHEHGQLIDAVDKILHDDSPLK